MKREIRLRVLVSGRVQGVGFRYFTERSTHALRVSGWVRNLPDGRVEAEVQGERAEVEKFLENVRIGPHGSRVDDVQTSPLSIQPGEDGFEIRT
jgi:acylphosphatase